MPLFWATAGATLEWLCSSKPFVYNAGTFAYCSQPADVDFYFATWNDFAWQPRLLESIHAVCGNATFYFAESSGASSADGRLCDLSLYDILGTFRSVPQSESFAEERCALLHCKFKAFQLSIMQMQGTGGLACDFGAEGMLTFCSELRLCNFPCSLPA